MILQNCNAQTDPEGQELQEHGTALMPAACYRDDLKQHPVPWHWHDEFEVAMVLAGEACVSVGTRCYNISEGNGIFINSGVLHSASAVGSNTCILHAIVFHPRLIGGSIDSIFWKKYIQPLMDHKSLDALALSLEQKWEIDSISNILRAWDAGLKEKYGYEIDMRAALSNLILEICKHLPTKSTGPSEKMLRDSERMKCMLTYIQEHFSEEITIGEIAASASISKSECLRCFKSIINTTPIQYVKQYRLQHAAELLVSTNRKIVDIGFACGFQEMSYFAKAFRETKGCSPKQYRLSKGNVSV